MTGEFGAGRGEGAEEASMSAVRELSGGEVPLHLVESNGSSPTAWIGAAGSAASATGHGTSAWSIARPAEGGPPDLFTFSGAAAALAGAHQVGLLAALVAGSATPEGFAEQLGLDPAAVAQVLDVLAAIGFADRTGDHYHASTALALFNATSPGGVARTANLFSAVPAFLHSGERPGAALADGPDGSRRPSPGASAPGGGGALSTNAARHLAAMLGGRPLRILALGAGSGIWSLAMAERHAARVTAVDHAEALPAFLARAETLNLADRVTVVPGDPWDVALPTLAFDRVVVAHLLHQESPERAAALVRRAAAALEPGGELDLIDVFGGTVAGAELARAVYGLHLTLATPAGRVHPIPEIERWTREAGLCPATFVALNGRNPGLGVVVTRRPAPADR
jgi:SAM-dependent methyltransferase